MMHFDGYVGRNPLLPPFSGVENHVRADAMAERNICSPLYSEFVLPDAHRLPGEFTVDRVPGGYGTATGSEWGRGDFAHLRSVQVKIEKVDHVETHAMGLPFRTMLLPTDFTLAESADVEMFPVSLPTDLRSSDCAPEKLPSEPVARFSQSNQSRRTPGKKLTPEPLVKPITIVLSDSDSDGEAGDQKKSRSEKHGGWSSRESEKKKGVKEASVSSPTPSSFLTPKQHASSSNSKLRGDEFQGRTPFKSLKRRFSFIDLDAVIDLDDDEPDAKRRPSSSRAGETSFARGFPAAEVKRVELQTETEVQTQASGGIHSSSIEAVASSAMGEWKLPKMEPDSVQQHGVSMQSVEDVTKTKEHEVSVKRKENPSVTEHGTSVQEEGSEVLCQKAEDVPTMREQGVSTPEVQNVARMENHVISAPKVEDVVTEHRVLGEKAEDSCNARESVVSDEKEREYADTTELGVPSQEVEDPGKVRLHEVSVEKVDDPVKMREQLFDLTHGMDETTIEELMYNDQDVLDLDIMSPEDDGYLQERLGMSSRDTKCEGLNLNPTYVQEELPSWYDAPSKRHEESVTRPFSAASQPVANFAAGFPTSGLELGRWNQGLLSQEAVLVGNSNTAWSSLHQSSGSVACSSGENPGQVRCETATSIKNDRTLQIFSSDKMDALGFLRLAVQASEARGAFVPPQITGPRVVPSAAVASGSMAIPVMTESTACRAAAVTTPSSTPVSTAAHVAPVICPLVSTACEAATVITPSLTTQPVSTAWETPVVMIPEFTTRSVSTAWEAGPVMTPSIFQSGSSFSEATPVMNRSCSAPAVSIAAEAVTVLRPSFAPPISTAAEAVTIMRPSFAPSISTAAEAAPEITIGMNPSVSNAWQAAPKVSSTVATPFISSSHAAPNMQIVSTAPAAPPPVMTFPSSAHGKSVLKPNQEPLEFDTPVGTPADERNNRVEEFVPVKPEWEANDAAVMDYRQMNIFALKTFELSRIRWAQIQLNIDPTGKRSRSDLKVACEMRKRGMWRNEHRPIGECPGVRVGDCFTYRIEMAIIGLHRAVQAGISTIPPKHNPYNRSIAASIVMNVHDSYTYKDDKDMGDRVIYSGQGGLATDQARTYTDQKPLRGNSALMNSEELNLPVRLIRGYKMQGSGTGTLYSYDGLYRVIDHEYQTGVNKNQVYLFHLVRLPGQPPIRPPRVSSLLYPAEVGPFPSPLDTRATLAANEKSKVGAREPVRSEAQVQEWGGELEEKPSLFLLPREQQSTPSKAGTSRPSNFNPQAEAFQTPSSLHQSQEQIDEYEEKPRLLLPFPHCSQS